MSMFGIKEAVVAPLIRRLVDDHDIALGRPAIQDLFARATWSGLVEPGDGTAGAMIAVLGPAAALTAVIEGWEPTRVLDVMAEAVADPGGDSVVGVGLAPRDVAAALARWQPRVSSAHTVTALQRAVRAGARLLTRDDAAWPQGFADLGHHAPIALWMRGNLPAMHALSSSYWCSAVFVRALFALVDARLIRQSAA
ncbi:hypothetical protein [Marisediminicola senii]|uniref:hypothetical protein n=1 Tax=Marisediminicola senii TaxID=2711233 RepID=UPI0013EB12B0|nr:hypothetical protein [Marisediminicola senii]